MAIHVKFKVPSIFKSVKYCLAGINGLFMLTGIVLIITGIVVLTSYSYYEEMINNRFFNIPAFTLSTGVLICLIAVLGFYGAISQSFYVIAAYVVFLLIVLVFEIAMVISTFALRNDAPTVIRTTMMESLSLYSNRLDIARMWDELQREFECCGVIGRFDFASHLIPVSCCHIDYGTISPFECGTLNAYDKGCASELGGLLAAKANSMAIIALLVTCIQVLLSGAAGWLAWKSKFEEVELEH